MAKFKGPATPGKLSKSNEVHIKVSGLIHTADSIDGGPSGLFVDRFGPPGMPDDSGCVLLDSGTHTKDKGFVGAHRKLADNWLSKKP